MLELVDRWFLSNHDVMSYGFNSHYSYVYLASLIPLGSYLSFLFGFLIYLSNFLFLQISFTFCVFEDQKTKVKQVCFLAINQFQFQFLQKLERKSKRRKHKQETRNQNQFYFLKLILISLYNQKFRRKKYRKKS